MDQIKKKKVSLFVSDLSANPIVRVYPIAKAIEKLGYDVEILGLTYNTNEVYKPYKDAFEYKTIQSYLDIRWVIINSRKLAKMATGDIVYAFKPLWGSFFPALLYSRFGFRKRLLLDAEDNELWDAYIGNGVKTLFKNFWYPVNPVYNKILHPATWFVKRKTVCCSRLQKRYGGIIVLHGPNADKFNPELLPERNVLRQKYNLPLNANLLLFAGRSVIYNGLPSLNKIFRNNTNINWELVLVGDPKNENFIEAKKILKEKCYLLGFIDNECMPEILKMVDVVPIIQTPMPATEMQIPAKMLEAMCMEKGIIATEVGDLPAIVSNKNGWIVPYDNEGAFLKTLVEIEQSPELLTEKGANARKYFIANASIDEIAKRIKPYFT